MKLKLIAAVALNGAIGIDNKMPWSVKEDIDRLKEMTAGKVVILGRKTAEFLPKSFIADRTFIVITSSSNLELNGDFHLVTSPAEALKLAQVMSHNTEAYVLGGQQIYLQMINLCDEAYITWINAMYPDADAFFPIGDLNFGFDAGNDDTGWQRSEDGKLYKFITYFRNND